MPASQLVTQAKSFSINLDSSLSLTPFTSLNCSCQLHCRCIQDLTLPVPSTSPTLVHPLSFSFFFKCVWLFATPWTAACQASLSITNSWSLHKLMSIELVMPSNHLILCHPLLLLPSISPSIRIFSDESALRIGWPKDWTFSFNISSSNEYSGLISFRMDWLDLLAVQGTLKSLLQHHSSKASILQRSAFFIVQFSHPYMSTGKTTAFTRWTFVGKVMSLLLNMLSRLVITFPRSKRLLISWLQSSSAVILEPPKTLFLGAPKSLQMVIAAMKLKDAYSLEGKLWPT